jgi:NADPH-dependent curcumin reductase CurA
MTNRAWTLARTPTTAFPQLEDFKMVELPIPTPGPNQMLTRTIYLSLDPYQVRCASQPA